MENDKEILERVTLRLRRAIENETGTSFDADEVRVVGTIDLSLPRFGGQLRTWGFG